MRVPLSIPLLSLLLASWLLPPTPVSVSVSSPREQTPRRRDAMTASSSSSSSSSSLFLFFSLFASVLVSIAAAADGDSHILLPRAPPAPVGDGSGFGRPAAAPAEEARLWCASWRLAAEVNNLAPWRTVPSGCVAYVEEYMVGKAYLSDLEAVAREAAQFARSVRVAGDGADAWVFDVDETLLSNLPYYADHGFGSEVFDSQQFDEWVMKATAPAVPSSLKLYEEILGLGFKVFLLTGRSEGSRFVTVDNLNKAGFHDWEKLILRGASDHGKSAFLFKSEKISEIAADGYRIIGNYGDQWTDLLGSPASHRSFKLPNPMYYIP